MNGGGGGGGGALSFIRFVCQRRSRLVSTAFVGSLLLIRRAYISIYVDTLTELLTRHGQGREENVYVKKLINTV